MPCVSVERKCCLSFLSFAWYQLHCWIKHGRRLFPSWPKNLVGLCPPSHALRLRWEKMLLIFLSFAWYQQHCWIKHNGSASGSSVNLSYTLRLWWENFLAYLSFRLPDISCIHNPSPHKQSQLTNTHKVLQRWQKVTEKSEKGQKYHQRATWTDVSCKILVRKWKHVTKTDKVIKWKRVRWGDTDKKGQSFTNIIFQTLSVR